MEWLTEWIISYGSVALFFLLMLGIVGLPIPDETLMVFCGYLIAEGKLQPVETGLAAIAGSWCGISLSYYLGRTLGVGAVHRFGKYMHLTDERLEKVNHWFRRAGHWTLFVGYYIAGVRHFTALVAGTSRLSFPTFAIYAWSGGLVWVGIFLSLGYYLQRLGKNWKVVAEAIHRDLLWASIVILTLVGVGLLIRWKLRKRAAAANAAPTAPSPAEPPGGSPNSGR